MAKILPARGSFPNPDADVVAVPGLVHVDSSVEDVVEAQHYATAYFGRGHVPGQTWPAQRVRVTGNALVKVLTYNVLPRLHMQDFRWRLRATASHAASTFRVQVVTGGPRNTDTVVGAGTAYYVADSSAVGPVNRGDLLTRIDVYMASGNAAGTVDLLSFELWDMDLAASQLP